LVAAVAGAGLAGCGGGGKKSSSTTTPGGAGAQKDATVAAEVPAAVRQKGTFTVAADASYPPNEFIAPDGHTVIGMDVDLANALGAVMGLKPSVRNATFDSIIPGLAAKKYDVGMSSFTDTKEREQTVDFVDYFSAGVLWAQRTGSPIDPNNACGKKVAVQSTTIEDTDEVPAKSDACVKAGKPPIDKQKFDRQDDATTALVLGKVGRLTRDRLRDQ
jgi:polar amino acid transport system substrate-binding protein